MSDVYKLYCEWDIGQGDVVFLSRKGAIKWATDILPTVGISDPVEGLMEEGLLEVKLIEIIADE